MEPEEQIKVLARIWSRNRDGYVFLPWIDGKARNKAERKAGYHEGEAFHWPTEEKRIVEHIRSHQDDDVYFTPCLFNAKRRLEDLADSEHRLWADLDEVNPEDCGDYRPTIAWETSPGRYQAIWCITGFKNGASWPGMENHRLTAFLGADPGGWDTTQLLRVPGGRNHKPHYKERNKGKPYQGKILWRDGEWYRWEDFDDLPEVQSGQNDDELLDEEFLKGIDRHQLWRKVRLGVSPTVREYMSVRTIDPDTVDRSEVAWQIERDLADAGCTLAEIVALIRPTPWNKYDGRNDELKRLRIEVSKAISFKKDDSVLEEIDDGPKPEGLVDFSEDEDFLKANRPHWLVKDFFIDGACGFISAIPKSLKSWLGLDLAFSVSRGIPFLDKNIHQPTNVLYIQQEDPESMVKDRLGRIADAKDYHWAGKIIYENGEVWWEPPKPREFNLFPVVMKGFSAASESWQDWLDEQIGIHNVGLVIMDTLTTISTGVDTDSSKEIKQKVLDPLKTIGRNHNCAMILIHHNRKSSDSTRAGQNMSGSGQIHAWGDCGIYITDKKESKLHNTTDIHFEVETKYTSSMKMTYRVEWGEEGLWNINYIIPDVGEVVYEEEKRTKKNSTREENIQEVIKIINEEGFTPSVREVAKRMNVKSLSTASSYLREAKKRMSK